MLVPSDTQAIAVRNWLFAALNTDDNGAPLAPAPFTDSMVYIGERDHPRAPRFARIATVAIAGLGVATSYEVENPGGPGQQLRERRGEWREWTTSITVASTLNPTAPQLADEAGQHLQRVVGAFRSTEATYDMRAVGVQALRHGEIQDVARLTGSQQWETRASVVLVWICGWTASTPVQWVEQVTGQGGVGGTPLPFDSDLGA